jgi:predicted GIY-YIG superfamily endonuclease
MAFWIYMLRCADASYYVGHTDNLEKRIAEHQSGAVSGYTQSRRPVNVMYSEALSSRVEALERERQIKGWSRAKKEALIKSDWEELSRLATRRRPSTSSGRTDRAWPHQMTPVREIKPVFEIKARY